MFKAGLGPKIDVAAPTVDVSSIANGSYLRGTVSISGACADDVAVQAVAVIVTIDSIQVATLPTSISGGTWSVSLDTNALSGGKEVQADLDIRVTDGTGKNTDKKLVVYFDNVKPLLTSMSPTADNLNSSNYAMSESEGITGSVKDGLGLAQTEVLVGTISYKDTTHPAAWSVVVDATQFYDPAHFSDLPNHGAQNGASYVSPGLYSASYSVVATDFAGNLSVPISGTLFINPSGSPIVDINGQTPAIGAVPILYPHSSGATNILAPGAKLKFRLFDMDGLDTSPAGLYLYLVPKAHMGDTDLSPYKHLVGATASDLSESDIIKIQPSGGGGPIPQEADFSLALPNGISQEEYGLLIHAGDFAANKINPSGPATSAASTVPPADFTGTRYISLFITNAKPDLHVTTPANGSFINSFLPAGNVIDGVFGPMSVAIKINADTATMDFGLGSPTTTTWAYSGTPSATPSSFMFISGNSYTATIVGTSNAGVDSDPQNIQFTWDTTPPTASVNSVSPEGGSNSPLAFTDDSTSSTAVGSYSFANAPGGVVDVVNGVAKFKGSASDSAALASSSWTIQHVTPSASNPWAIDAPIIAQNSFSASTMSNWTLDVDTSSGFIQGDYYALTIKAMDKATNSNALLPTRRTFQVDQSADLPTFTLSNMVAAATSGLAKNNLLNTKVELDATVSDDDRVLPSSLRIYIDPKDGGGNPNLAYVTIANAGNLTVQGTANPATGNVSFAYSFATLGTGTGTALGEGRHFFYLQASDDPAWKGGAGAASATIGPVWFAIDTHQPQINFAQSGGLFVNSSTLLSGTVDSANALDITSPFTITPQSGSPVSPTLSPAAASTGSHSWSYSLDVSGSPEGPLAVTAVAKDEFGLTSTSTFSVTVDKTPPDASIANATQYFSDLHGYTLTGTTRDVTSGVASMSALVLTSPGAVNVSPSAPLTLNSTAGTPNAIVNPTLWPNWGLDLSGLATGSYTVQLTITDKAGNVASPGVFTVNVDKDLPTASLATDSALLNPLDGAVYNSASAAISANWTAFTDDAFFDHAEVWLDGTTLLGGVIAVKGAWSFPLTWASILETTSPTHTLSIRAWDKGGHLTTTNAIFKKDTIAPAVTISAPDGLSWLSGATYTVRGAADDDGGMGVDHVNFIADAAATSHAGDNPLTWAVAGGGVSWSGTINLLTLGEGNKQLWVKSLDKAGNWNALATTVAFSVDQNPPSLSETVISTASTVYRKANFSLSGSASDTNALAASHSLQVSIDGGAAVDVTALPGIYTHYTGSFVGSTWTINADTSGALLDGQHTYVVTATDIAGKQTTVTRSVFVDTQAATVTINAPGAVTWVGGATYLVKGNTDDGAGSGVAQVYFKVDIDTANHTADDPLTWTLATGAASWSSIPSIDLLALGEGNKKLWVKSLDKAGNWNALATTVLFGVDQNPPNLTVTAPPANINASTAAAFAGIAGFAWDSNALAAASSLTVSYTKNGGIPTTSAIPVVDTLHAGPGNAWLWTPFPSGIDLSAGHSDDGSYAFTFTATDAAGKTTTSGTSNVTIDTALPTISYSYPSASTSLNGLATVRGSATDTSQVALVEYSLDGGVSYTAVTGDKYTWSFSFDTRSAAQGGTPGLAQGAFTLRVRATDSAGNRSVVGTLALTLDQTSDYPVISLTNMDQTKTTAGGAASNLQESNAKIQGTITDDDWVDVSSIQYSIDGGLWANAAIVGASSSSVYFEQSLSSLSDGIHFLSVRSYDSNDGANNRKGGLPTVQSTLTSVYFAVDKSNPVVIINTPGSTFTTGPLVLTGSVTDGNRSMQVLVSTNGGGTYSATGVSGFSSGLGTRTWTWTGDLSAKPEGPFDIKVKGIDEYAKESIADLIITVDITGPTMSISTPVVSSTVNGPVTISGQGIENYGIDHVQVGITPQGSSPATVNAGSFVANSTYTILSIGSTNFMAIGAASNTVGIAFKATGPGTGTGTASEWVTVTGSYAWSYLFDTTTRPDGIYTISVRGYDVAGNVTAAPDIAASSRDFTINQASDKPTLSIATILASGTYVQNLLPGSLQISGTASDDDAVAHLSVQIRVDRNNDGLFNAGDGGWQNWTNVTGQSTIDANIANWSHTFVYDPTGVAGLPEGNYCLEIRVADVNFWAAHPTAAVNPDWTSFSDGFKWTSGGVIRFAIDKDPPTGTATPASGLYTKDPGTHIVHLAGTASDGSGILSVKIKFNNGAPQDVVDDGGATPFSAWHYDYPITVDGQVSWQVVLTDNFNKPSTIDRYFTIDTTPPAPVFTQPTAGSTVNGALTIRGSTTDSYQVASVYLWIGAHLATPPDSPSTGDWTGWNLLSGTYNWQYSFDTRSLSDGAYDVYVRSVDGAGNISLDSAPTLLSNIHIDQTTNYPVFSLTNMNASPSVNLFGAGGIITGTVADDDGIAASTIQISFDNGSSWANVSNQGTDGFTVSWSHTIPLAVLDSGTAYQVMVRAKDIGQTVAAIVIPQMTTTSPAYLVAVDRVPPAVAASAISYLNRYSPFGAMPDITGGSMTGAKIFNNFTLKIDASSTAGLAAAHAVTVSVNGVAATDATYSGSGTIWNYAVPIDVAGHANDGNMTLAITVTDTWSKVSSSSLAVVIDTAEPVLTYSQPAANSSVNGATVNVVGTTFEAVGIASLTIQGGLANAPMTNTGTTQSWAATFDSNGFCNPASATINAMGMTTVNGSGTLTTTSAYALSVGDLVYFYGASLPAQLDPSKPYYVIAANGGAHTFQVAARPSGTMITMSSTAAGVFVQKNGITWLFPITVTAVDTAGNKKTLGESVNIDPNSAKPVIVEATLMPTNGASVAGAILLQSTVQGQNSPDHVRIYADLNDDGVITPGAYPRDLNSNGNTTDPFEKEDIYLDVPITNGVWSVIVDNNGEFSKANMILRGIAAATGWMQLQVVPYDSLGIAGNVSYRRVYVDSTAPAFGGLNFLSGALVKGSITATGWIEDDGLLALANLQISTDGGTTFNQLANLSGPTVVGGMNHYTFSQPINTVTVSGGALYNPVSSTLYTILKSTDATFKQTQVNLNFNVDNSPPTTDWNYGAVLAPILGVAGSGTETYGFSGNGVAASKAFGRAIDAGAISGIDHINVYFVKGGFFLDPKHLGTTGPQYLTIAGDQLYDKTGTSVQTGVPFTEDAYAAGGAGNHFAITIDKRTELGQFDANGTLGDNDGFNESLQAKTGSPNYDEWYSYFDSTKLPDGPLTVYFVAYDQAGNKSYGMANAQVMNNPPSVLNFADHAQPTNYFVAAADGKIKIKYAGTFSLDIQATDSGSNSGLDVNWGIKRLTVAARYGATGGGDIDLASPKALTSWYYGSGGLRAFNATSASPLPATGTIQINTVSDGFVEGDWYQLTAQVTDNDGNIATKDLWMRVNNSDLTNPTVTFDPGNLTQAGSVGFWTQGQGPLQQSNIDYSKITVANPSVITYTLPAWMGNGTKVAFAGTRVPGGLASGTVYYIVANTGTTFQLSATPSGAGLAVTSTSVGTYDLVSGGRTEAAGGDSLYSSRAAVSGSVLLFGTTYDNTDVSSLTVTIDGSASQPVTLTNRSGSVLLGYTYNWYYLWDTSGVAGSAKASVPIAVTATDNAANSYTTATINVDVLPYITSVTDSTGLSADVLRGSNGEYSIRTDAVNNLTLLGYNFGTGGSGLKAFVSPTAANPTAGTAYTTTRDGTYSLNKATVSKNIARSGYLTLVYDDATAKIPSLNNLDKDVDASHNVVKAYNMEQGADPRSFQWTDDRYLWVWAVSQLNAPSFSNQTFYYPSMVMSPTTNGVPWFSYTDDNGGDTHRTVDAMAGSLIRSGNRFQRQATQSTVTLTGTGGAVQTFILTGQDTTQSGDNIGYLELTGFSDAVVPDAGNNVTNSWIELQGEDYPAHYAVGASSSILRKTNRFPYPKLIAEDAPNAGVAGAAIYSTFYDASLYYQSLNFVSFRTTAKQTSDSAGALTQDYLRLAQVTPIPGTVGRASPFFDMVRLGTNGIAVAYYDSVSASLKLAYSSNAFAVTGVNTTDRLPVTTGQEKAVYQFNVAGSDTQANYTGKYFTIYTGAPGTAYDVFFDTTAGQIAADPGPNTGIKVNLSAAALPTFNRTYVSIAIVNAVRSVAAFANSEMGSIGTAAPTSNPSVVIITNNGNTTDATLGTLNTGTAIVTGAPAITQGTAAGTAAWTTITLDSSANVGQNLSMVVSGSKIYIAYYDYDDSDLKLLRCSTTIAGAGVGTVALDASTTVRIDTYLSAGTWTDIGVINDSSLTGQASNQPFITYYADSYNGTKKPVRIAFPKFDASGVTMYNGTTNSGADDTYSGYWVVATIPAMSVPKGGMEQFSHTMIGTYSNGGLTLPVEAWLGDYLEYAKLQPNN